MKMKKFLIAFLLFSCNAFAQNAEPRTILFSNCDGNSTLVQNIVYNGRVYLVHQRCGFYYVNNEYAGSSIVKTNRNGKLYINERPIEQYNFSQGDNSANDDHGVSVLYTRAFSKYYIQDYEGAIDECKKILKIDQNYKRAVVLKTLSEEVLENKLAKEKAKAITRKDIDKIVKESEKNLPLN